MKKKQVSRYFQISAWNLMIFIGILYLLLVWLGYRQLERNMNAKRRGGQVFRPKLSQNGGLQLYVKECPLVYSPHHILSLNYSLSKPVQTLKPGTCPARPKPMKSNIQMEREWSSISVGYPQYVYTVSGWIQVIDVPDYDVKPLRVIIVPHSHQDPGWKETFDGYYMSYTRKTLDNIVKFLSENPKWKFIWSEVSYLEKWFINDVKKSDQLKRLIERGQLEIVTGGWVMTDEAVAHYGAMLEQLVGGHQWLHQNLGIVPNTSWSVDPFGHSPTMTYFLKRSGINKMVIQRVHFGIKRHFANKQTLEFMWRQAWDSTGDTGVMCHLMPFLLYAIHYSCGPDPHVCCQFDFHKEKCFRGTEELPKITVNDQNIRKLAWALWEQFQKKSHLYQSNVLLVPHGDDFRYSSTSEWSEQFGNLGKLMNYMNKDKDMDIKIEFGTISDYFQALSEDTKKSAISFPSLTGDFLPYNDRDDQYWTGFYSVRPLYKHMARVLQAKLRITEIIFVQEYAQAAKAGRDFYADYLDAIIEARRTLSLFQHHDAITGTSQKVVMSDYGRRLQTAIAGVNSLLSMLMLHSMSVKVQNKRLQPHTISMTDEWNSVTLPPVLKVSHMDGKWFVIVTNPLTTPWKSHVTVRTSTPSVVKTLRGSLIPSQINPVFASGLQPSLGLYDVVFISDLAALSMQVYQLVEDVSTPHYASVTIFGKQLTPGAFIAEFHPKVSRKATVDIENNLLKSTFSTCSGTMQYTLRKTDGTVHKTTVKMVTYGTGSWTNPFKDKSGAYVFMPDGHAQELEVTYPSMVVVKGPIMSSVISELPGVVHSSSLYNISGPVAAGVHIDNLVDISSKDWNNNELAMRIVTDVISPDSTVCVDLNGFQMHRKKWRSKLLIQGNFHPMTSMAFIEDEKLYRMTLITSESHGVASLNQGTMEVILDRRLMQDDWRGLNEGPHDNVPNPSKFVLIPERRDTPGQSLDPSCYPSMLAQLISNHLSNPLQAAFLGDQKLKPQAVFLSEPWPCSSHLLNLRIFETLKASEVKALVFVQKHGLDCNYSQTHKNCDMGNLINFKSFKNLKVDSAKETTLTGVKELKPLPKFTTELKEMEITTVKISFR